MVVSKKRFLLDGLSGWGFWDWMFGFESKFQFWGSGSGWMGLFWVLNFSVLGA